MSARYAQLSHSCGLNWRLGDDNSVSQRFASSYSRTLTTTPLRIFSPQHPRFSTTLQNLCLGKAVLQGIFGYTADLRSRYEGDSRRKALDTPLRYQRAAARRITASYNLITLLPQKNRGTKQPWESTTLSRRLWRVSPRSHEA